MVDEFKPSAAGSYRHRADALRLLAADMHSPEGRIRILALAASFERLAETAGEREAKAAEAILAESGTTESVVSGDQEACAVIKSAGVNS